jgi:ankyrin repeat protein
MEGFMNNDRPGVDRMGRTGLHYAALNGDLSETLRLLASGLDPCAKDDHGFTPLHFSTQSNCLPVSEALLSAGAEVDAVDRNGNTPLSNAVFYSGGAGALITLLLRCGADPNLENNHGVSPIGLARTMANPELVRFFDPGSAGTEFLG